MTLMASSVIAVVDAELTYLAPTIGQTLNLQAQARYGINGPNSKDRLTA
jgi:hypothetical protein